MFDPTKRSKIKNAKIEQWRAEMGAFSYDVAFDTLSRICGRLLNDNFKLNLRNIHDTLGHPGITRLNHFVKSKNLPYSTQDVKEICRNCKICAELKPRFFRKEEEALIQATQPWQRLSIDFKGPLRGKNSYILSADDQYSRYPFAFPCKNMNSKTVISCLKTLFCFFGLPGFIHSDRQSSFMSKELKAYLHSRGVATSRTTLYNPTGNAQCERVNQTVRRTIKLMLKSQNLPEEGWEEVLQDALHATRSLLCTSTNETPHDRFLAFPRKSMLGKSMPNWLLNPGAVLLRKFVRNKGDPLCDHM